jgi:hypothetical protein
LKYISRSCNTFWMALKVLPDLNIQSCSFLAIILTNPRTPQITPFSHH